MTINVNIPASVYKDLQEWAKAEGQDFDGLLRAYATQTIDWNSIPEDQLDEGWQTYNFQIVPDPQKNQVNQ